MSSSNVIYEVVRITACVASLGTVVISYLYLQFIILVMLIVTKARRNVTVACNEECQIPQAQKVARIHKYYCVLNDLTIKNIQ